MDRLTKLVKEQRAARGLVRWKGLEGKTIQVQGPYEATPENEARAAEIIWLRRKGARE